jgi:hypothetical protein
LKGTLANFQRFTGEEDKLCAKSSHESGREAAVFVREFLMLETRESRNLVNIVNSFCSLMEYFLPLSVFLNEQHHVSVEPPHSSEWEKHCMSCKRSINVKARGPLTLLCILNCVST